MRVKIDKYIVLDLYHAWFEANPNHMHPLTSFMATLGLRYLQLFRNEAWICEIIDQNKFMLAKIKYGF